MGPKKLVIGLAHVHAHTLASLPIKVSEIFQKEAYNVRKNGNAFTKQLEYPTPTILRLANNLYVHKLSRGGHSIVK